MLNEGWLDQYERMLRSRKRLADYASGKVENAGSDEVRDMLFHFFQDAYHLKDWLKNDPGQTKVNNAAIEAATDAGRGGLIELALTGDLCNGIKHLRLTSARTGDLATTVTSQSVNIHAGTVGGSTPGWVEHHWTIESDGKQYDAGRLADDICAAWEAWLRGAGLL